MKNISKPQYRRFVPPAWLAITLTVLGCGSVPDGQGAGDDSGANRPLRIERNVGPIPENGYCGSVSLGTDDRGREFAEGEYYAADAINETLANDPDLRAFTGLTRVETCEDARAFGTAQQAYRALGRGAPATPKPWPKDLPIQPVDEEELNRKLEAIKAEEEVPKILNGAPATKTETVQILYLMDEMIRADSPTLYKKWASCTAVRIAGPLFLTAAHCINPYFMKDGSTLRPLYEPTYHLDKIEISYKFGGSDVKTFSGRCNDKGTDCYILKADAYIHPKYTGFGTDSDSDLAVIYVTAQDSLRAFEPGWTTYSSFLSSQLPTANEPLTVYGWGPVSNTDTKQGSYQERTVPGFTTPISLGPFNWRGDRVVSEGGHNVNFTFDYGSFAITTTATKQFCKGDSGAPAYADQVRVAGILHGLNDNTPSPTLCVGASKDVYFSRTDLVLDWLPRAVKTLQSGAGPALANTCGCVYNGDPTNPNDPLSYIDCSVGCRDPKALPPF